MTAVRQVTRCRCLRGGATSTAAISTAATEASAGHGAGAQVTAGPGRLASFRDGTAGRYFESWITDIKLLAQ